MMLLLRCFVIPFSIYSHLTAVVEVYLSYVIVHRGLQPGAVLEENIWRGNIPPP